MSHRQIDKDLKTTRNGFSHKKSLNTEEYFLVSASGMKTSDYASSIPTALLNFQENCMLQSKVLSSQLHSLCSRKDREFVQNPAM